MCIVVFSDGGDDCLILFKADVELGGLSVYLLTNVYSLRLRVFATSILLLTLFYMLAAKLYVLVSLVSKSVNFFSLYCSHSKACLFLGESEVLSEHVLEAPNG